MLEETVLAIHLICAGGGLHASGETATMVRGTDFANPVRVTRTVRSNYEDEAEVEITGDKGRIRVPVGVKPGVRSGGNDGWWDLKNLRITPNEIKAKVSLNFINKPTIRIDRRTGNIAIRGRTGTFNGYCEAYDPATTPRRF